MKYHSFRSSGIKRYPSSWSFGTVMATCCSLDTLTSAELEAIRDDYILVGCKVCNADVQQPIHLQVLSQSLKVFYYNFLSVLHHSFY